MNKVILFILTGISLTNGLNAKNLSLSCFSEHIVEGSDFINFGYGCISDADNLYYRGGYHGEVKSVEFNRCYTEYDKQGRIVASLEDNLIPEMRTFEYDTDKNNHITTSHSKVHQMKNDQWDKGVDESLCELYNDKGWRIAVVMNGDTIQKTNFDKKGHVVSFYSYQDKCSTYSYDESGFVWNFYEWDGEEDKFSEAPMRIVKFDKYGFILDESEFHGDDSYFQKHSYSYTYYPTGELKSVTKYQDHNKNQIEWTYVYNKDGKLESIVDTYIYYPTGDLNSVTIYHDKTQEEVAKIYSHDKKGHVIEGRLDDKVKVRETYDTDGHLIDEVLDEHHYIYTYTKNVLTSKQTYSGNKLESIDTYDKYGNCIKTVEYQNGEAENTSVYVFTYF